MKNKYKVLLTGKNKAVIDDIFLHTDTDIVCLSTSARFDDVRGHLDYFEPDAFVYCLKAEESEDINCMKRLKSKMHQLYIPFVIIGDQSDCNEFQKQAYNTADLVLTRPITLAGIQEKIIGIIEEWRNKKLIRDAENMETPKTEVSAVVQESIENILKEQEQSGEDRRGHILVVDDDPRMLKVIRANLRDEYDVASAISGKLAFKFLEKHRTDLILLDYEMPGMKGPETFRLLKQNPKLSDIPVVFLTGVGELTKVQEVLEMKPQGYLLKPVDRSKLRSCVKDLIG